MSYHISACIIIAFWILGTPFFEKIEAKDQHGRPPGRPGGNNNNRPNNNNKPGAHQSGPPGHRQNEDSTEPGKTLDDLINDVKQTSPSSGYVTPFWGVVSPKTTTEEPTRKPRFICQNAIGFRCLRSGKCINANLMCNGVQDCEDGSDENCEQYSEDIKSVCLYSNLDTMDEYSTYYNACKNIQRCFNISDEESCYGMKTTSSPITVTTESVLMPGSCIMPENPANGTYIIGQSPPGTYKPGVSILPFQALLPQCNTLYKPSPPYNRLSICINGQWEPTPAKCSLACESKTSTTTTDVTCKFKGIPLDTCNDAVEGTLATITCQPLYEELSLERFPDRICRNGKWNLPFVECYPMCGVKRPEGIPSIISGKVVEQGNYPWHVGVYDANTKDYKCGGSILNHKVVLSAAHCFSKLSNGEKYPKENYAIAAGKYYSNYDDERDISAQYSSLDEIYIPNRYKGEVTLYEADIALLILTTSLEFSLNVLPVCLDRHSNSAVEAMIFTKTPGTVVGWGRTEEDGETSDKLKELVVPYIPFDQCYEEVPILFRRFLTHDKICAGILNQGQATCQGDSGGGLAFPDIEDRYYIRGIVSTSPATTRGTCDSNQHGTYTRVSNYLEFIQEYEMF